MKIIRVGSRESRLAVIQARLIMSAIERHHPDIRTELISMKTTGDRILDRPLDAVGGKGLFIKELDEALASGRVDLCVHSYKDMPVPDNPELPVVAVSAREDPRDVLILPPDKTAPDADKPLGTSSARRRLQLALLYPGLSCEPVRGNVQTRLAKLEAGQFGGLVLAAAGLRRLDLWERASRAFSVEEIIPSACQGILAMQGRSGEDYSYLQEIDNADARDASTTERAFIEALDGGCTSPTAAHAQISGDEIILAGLHVDGADRIHRGTITGKRSDAKHLGAALAERLKKEGEQDA